MTRFSTYDRPENPAELEARGEATAERESAIEAFEAGFWAGRADYRNVLEAWHAHTGQEPPTLEQLKAYHVRRHR